MRENGRESATFKKIYHFKSGQPIQMCPAR